jgi:hypothetical protein
MPIDQTQSPPRYVAPEGANVPPNGAAPDQSLFNRVTENYQDIKQSRTGNHLQYVDFADRYFTNNLQVDLSHFDGYVSRHNNSPYTAYSDNDQDLSIRNFDYYKNNIEKYSPLKDILDDILSVEPKNASVIETMNTTQYQGILDAAHNTTDLPIKHQNTIRDLNEVFTNNPTQFRDYAKLISDIHSVESNSFIISTQTGLDNIRSEKYSSWENAKSLIGNNPQEQTYHTENFKDFLNVRYSEFRGLYLSDDPLPNEADGIVSPELYGRYRESLDEKITARLNVPNRNFIDVVRDLKDFRETDSQHRIFRHSKNTPDLNNNPEVLYVTNQLEKSFNEDKDLTFYYANFIEKNVNSQPDRYNRASNIQRNLNYDFFKAHDLALENSIFNGDPYQLSQNARYGKNMNSFEQYKNSPLYEQIERENKVPRRQLTEIFTVLRSDPVMCTEGPQVIMNLVLAQQLVTQPNINAGVNPAPLDNGLDERPRTRQRLE